MLDHSMVASQPGHPTGVDQIQATRQPRWRWLLSLLALGAFWLVLVRVLSSDWDVNPQYSYSYIVPLLTAALLWTRWPVRPTAEQPRRSGMVLFLALVALLLLLPLRLILEANPEWRLLYWIHSSLALTLTASWLYW